MVKVAVIGATGYTGLELVRILLSHPSADIKALTSNSRAGTQFSEIFPSFSALTSLVAETLDPDSIAERCDVAFTALPHGSSMGVVESLIERGVKVVDLSADFRFSDLQVYNEWYGEHKVPHLVKESVYGLPEINRDRIASTALVANPGCYPTSVILPLIPLIRNKVIDPATIVVNSASGVSGAGRSSSVGTIFCEVNDGFKAYKVGEHRHTPEIEEVLKAASGEGIRLTFTPHLAPMNRGILSTITAGLKGKLHTGDILKLLEGFYKEETFIRILPEGIWPATSNVRGSNYCDISAKVDQRTGRVVLVSAIDNLVKGASGQAVQNMNIMFCLDEGEGLRHIPVNV